MNDIKWIKISTDLFDNRKIKQIESLPDGYALIVVWLKLLCLAGKTNNNGFIYITKEIPYTEQTLATQFNMPLTTIQLALTTFEKFNMIEIINDVLCISNWELYQNIEGMEKVREQTRLRNIEYRKRKKEALMLRDATMTSHDAIEIDIDIDKEYKRENIKEKTSTVFRPPTLEDVQSYISEKKYHVNAERFINFYESKGWMIGKNKMKDWKAAVRTWEQDYKNKPKNETSNKFCGFNQTEYDFDTLERDAGIK